uniref:Uncharacterized protein n=1 Tax=Labrus bergylta TaxID=56723 RepID=A0A3Q3FVF8_9LABR
MASMSSSERRAFALKINRYKFQLLLFLRPGLVKGVCCELSVPPPGDLGGSEPSLS